MDLFNQVGAEFSSDRAYRFALWRIWDTASPLVMFIGLNPSSANEIKPDPTILSVTRISKFNGFGGFYMMNCFPYVSTDPDALNQLDQMPLNNSWLLQVAAKCKAVVFAWGNFTIVRKSGRDIELASMFPGAFCLGVNDNGSPKHPLFQKSKTLFVPFTMNSPKFNSPTNPIVL